jgi:hypothetical protein
VNFSKENMDAIECVPIESVPDLLRFNWDSEGSNDIWRRLTDYVLYDSSMNYANMLVEDGSDITIHGSLVPPLDLEDQSQILVKFKVIQYAIDFGKSVEDDNRGFWLFGPTNGDPLSKPQVWYKLLIPRHEYQYVAEEHLKLCNQFLKFYDAIVYGSGSIDHQALSTMNKKAGAKKFKHRCPKDVKEVSSISNQYFDIECVRQHATFFYKLLQEPFDVNCKLMRDLIVSVTKC